MFQKMVRQMKGECRLADAVRSGKDQRMRQLAGPVCGGQHRRDLGMADQPWCFRRLRHAVQRVVLLRGDAFEDHAGAACFLGAGIRSSSAANTAAVTTCSTVSGSAEASMTMQRCGS